MVEVLANAWRYWRTVCWEYRETPGGNEVPLRPLEQLGGVTEAFLGPSKRLEGQSPQACASPNHLTSAFDTGVTAACVVAILHMEAGACSSRLERQFGVAAQRR